MTELYLVRHAHTEGNRERAFQGHTDADLSVEGEAQLERLSDRFATIGIDRIYTSPLIRARKTAEAINRHHGKEILVDPGLIEINAGDLEGMPFSEVYEKYPEEINRFLNAPETFAMPGGESMKQVYDRITAAIGRIVEQNKGLRIVVVSHGCALQNYLAHVLGYGQQGLSKSPICYNTGISHIRFTQENSLPFVVSLNDASHLDADLLAHSKWELKV